MQQDNNLKNPKLLTSRRKAITEVHKKNIINEILKQHDSLRPAKYWMQPKKFRDLVYALYSEYKNKNSKCCICNKAFHNNLVRDFHINTIHQIEVLYSCEKCEVDNIQDDIHFKSIYEYFGHMSQYHDN